ncbi:MAG: sigma-70 family RNA polymerase sigma factor [Chitinophagaceae bacterium]|nr:sigma-70 family RNA polymerase sigma factor [Chitinophagaceae bacterium]
MTDDRQLVRNCLKGQAAAQKELYERFAGLMMGICYRYTKSVTDAEDVLQDGFVKVFRQLHSFRFDGELGAWIRRIMVNTAINYLKKHSGYRAELSFDAHDNLHPVSEEDAELKLTAKELAELIRQLPTGYQTIFNLHAVEGFTHVEIGQMLGISDGTSRSQYARARQLLLSWMEKNEMTKNKLYAGK